MNFAERLVWIKVKYYVALINILYILVKIAEKHYDKKLDVLK